jgi:hypothetical protein
MSTKWKLSSHRLVVLSIAIDLQGSRMFCNKCGHIVADDANFCPYCEAAQPTSVRQKPSAEVGKFQSLLEADSTVKIMLQTTLPLPSSWDSADVQKPGLSADCRHTADREVAPMKASVCPYCRGPVDTATDKVRICEECETPHHSDCYRENGGCTVFGCRCGPPDEPKLRVDPPEIAHGAVSAGTSMFGLINNTTPRTYASNFSLEPSTLL